MTCSTDTKGPIHFYIRDEEDTSSLINVIISNVSVVQVSSKPPIMQNVQIVDTDAGLVFVGSGIANEHDIAISDTSVLKVYI